MLRRRLDLEHHGSDGYTSVSRLVAISLAVGFFVVGAHMLTRAWYDGRMLPGVMIADRQVGGLTLAQTRQIVLDKVKNYRLQLQVADKQYQVTAEQLGVRFDVEATLASAYASGRDAYLPPLNQPRVELAYHLNRAELNAFAGNVVSSVGIQPVDAAIVAKSGVFETVPDKSGWSVDKVGLVRLVEDDLRSPGGVQLKLSPREQVADIQVGELGPVIEAANRLAATPIVLHYGDRTYTPAPVTIKGWFAFEKTSSGRTSTLAPKVERSKLKNYVQSLANQLDVAPVNKKVTVENGVSRVTQEGVNGSAIDQDQVTAAVEAAVMNQTALDYTITAHEVPFKTVSTTLVSLDLGRYIEVNLSKQHLWVWQDHNVIYDSPITSGAARWGFGTAQGLFSIYYKTTNTHLTGYQYGWNYDVAVKYWMPFYKGFGLHDASWRNGQFGGSDWYYNGSHGCVNLPDAAAEFIYNWSTIGTPVWVHQ